MEGTNHRKRVRDSAESRPDPESKRIRDDLLSLLDDSDAVPDRDSPSQDLDSVIRSFEAEISTPPPPVVDLTADSGESPPDLGQLFGYDTKPSADLSSLLDDGAELVRVETESDGIGEFWEFQDELRSINSVGFGASYEDNTGNGDNNHEYEGLDGIFEYSDVNFGSDLWWPPETLPAL